MERSFLNLINNIFKTYRNHLVNCLSSKEIGVSIFPTRMQESPSLQAALHTKCVTLVFFSQLFSLGGLSLENIASGILSGMSID